MQLRSRSTRILAAAAVAVGGLTLIAQPASASSVMVDTNADSGPGSFRAAVEAASVPGSSIDTITFKGGLDIDLSSAIEFTGSQDLTIDGRYATVSGASVDPDIQNDSNGGWDSGLFVARGGGNLTLRKISFEDSFNNGIGVFLPTGEDVKITLDRVSVTNSQFHGILVDGQSTTGYNTDDIIHLACKDPYAVDSGTSIDLDINKTTITGAGQLAGDYDLTLLTGCPQDFDGLRVDQGGDGDITGTIAKSTFDSNLADGAELDEKGAGSVDVEVSMTSFSSNGLTVEIECTTEYLGALGVADPGGAFDRCTAGDELADLDDGFDIDEEGDGDLVATVSRSTVNLNNDEGLDFDEAGEGSIELIVEKLYAAGNNDQAVKASEEDAGDVTATIEKSTIVDGNDDGIELEEEGAGSITASVSKSTITDNGGDGVKVAEADNGNLDVDVSDSTITGNGEDEEGGGLDGETPNEIPDGNAVDVEQEDGGEGSLAVTNSDLSNHDTPISPADEGDDGIGSITLANVIF